MTQEYTAEQAKQEAIESNKKFLEQELAIIITTIKLAASALEHYKQAVELQMKE